MDSPELHPLPPLLNRQTPVNSGHQMGFSSRQLEGSEEFYSPRESVGVGSMSRRGFESVEVGKVNMSRSSSSSSSLYSGSPARSGSLSVSPSISASPNRAVSRPKSPELEAVELETLPVESDRVLDGSDNKDRNVLVFNPFRFSSVVDDENVGCSEGNKDHVVQNEDDSDLKVSGLADQNEGLQPEDSEERIRESGSLTSVVSDHNVDSLDVVTGLAENDNECLQESRRSDVSDQSVESLKSVIPVAGLEVKDDEFYTEPLDSDVLDQSVSMVSGLAVKEDEYFPETRSSNGLDQSVESPKSVTSPVKGSGDTFESYSQSLDLDVQSPQQVASPVAEMVDVSELSSTSSNLTDHSVESIERFASPVSEMVDVTELSSTSSNVTDHSVESAEKFASPVAEIVDVSESHSTSFNVPDHSVESPEKFASPVAEMVDVSESYSTSSNVPDHSVESPERFPIPVSEMFDVSESYSTSSIVPDHSVECPVKQDPPAVLDASEQLPPPIFVPPPPPPPPPRKFWESPRTPTSLLRKSISGPPALVAPLRPMVIESPILISPMQLPNNRESSEASAGTSDNLDEGDGRSEETPKPKLKPLHWDKVRASSDREMVWDQLRSSSFKLNEEMIESLFIVKAPNSTHVETTRRQILPLPNQDNRVLDAKKSQNIAILLKALHVTVDEVCESLLEGNAETLGTDLLESLLKMAPSKEEEQNLKEHKDDSPVKLGSAERFLKEVLDIPFAFKRIDAMLYISNFDSEVEYLKKSFETLETASEELRNSRMFLKLLEAVLKTGNRMNVGTNRGDAHAFKLDTLLKLVDIKGADGKTTLLHFVVQEITRTEGARISESNSNQTSSSNDDVKCRKLGLQVVSSLASDLTNVKKAAAMDSEVLNSDVMKLSKGLEKIMEVIRLNETIGSDQISYNKFSESMNKFMKFAEEEIIRIQAQESVALTLVKEITEYFHGNSAKEEAHPFRIFMVVRDFLSVLERVCKEVGMINERTIVSSAHKFPVPVNPMLQPVSSGFPGRRQGSSSDDEIPTS